MHRVPKPGEKGCIQGVGRGSSDKMCRSRVKFITKLTFRFILLKRAYTKREFEHFLAQTDFGSNEIKEDLTGLELVLQRAGAA